MHGPTFALADYYSSPSSRCRGEDGRLELVDPLEEVVEFSIGEDEKKPEISAARRPSAVQDALLRQPEQRKVSKKVSQCR